MDITQLCDCWPIILDSVPNGQLFKTFLFTCRRFAHHYYFGTAGTYYVINGTYASEKYWLLIDRFSNHIETRIKMHGILNSCDVDDVSVDFIDKHNDIGWNWRKISRRSDLTPNFIDKYYNKLVLEHVAKYCRNLTADFIRARRDWLWPWRILAINKSFTPKMIADNSDLPWKTSPYNPNQPYLNVVRHRSYRYVLRNYPASIERKLTKIVIASTDEKDYLTKMSLSNAITDDIVADNPDFPWDMDMRARVVPDFRYVKGNALREYLDGLDCTDATAMDWTIASMHAPMDIIFEYDYIPWNELVIIGRPEFNLSMLETELLRDIDSDTVASSANLKLPDYLKHMYLLDKKRIRSNPHASWLVHAIVYGNMCKLSVPRAMINITVGE